MNVKKRSTLRAIATLIVTDGPQTIEQICEKMKISSRVVRFYLHANKFFSCLCEKWSIDNETKQKIDAWDRRLRTPRNMSGMKTFSTQPGAMDEASIEARKGEPRACRGTCGRTLTFADFEISIMRGKRYYRVWCNDCLKAYYKARDRLKKQKRIHQLLELHELEKDSGLPGV